MPSRRLETPAFAPRPMTSAVRMRGQRLNQAERVRLILEIVAAYARARRALGAAPIASVVAGLRSEHPASPAEPADALEEARRLARAVMRTLALLPGDTRCLIRSLVLTQLLARRGISAKLVIGARTAPEFLGHAWVEHSGEAILAPGDGSFGRLVEL